MPPGDRGVHPGARAQARGSGKARLLRNQPGHVSLRYGTDGTGVAERCFGGFLNQQAFGFYTLCDLSLFSVADFPY